VATVLQVESVGNLGLLLIGVMFNKTHLTLNEEGTAMTDYACSDSTSERLFAVTARVAVNVDVCVVVAGTNEANAPAQVEQFLRSHTGIGIKDDYTGLVRSRTPATINVTLLSGATVMTASDAKADAARRFSDHSASANSIIPKFQITPPSGESATPPEAA
jgi:hypothetical protein